MFLFIKPFSGFLPHSQSASADNKSPEDILDTALLLKKQTFVNAGFHGLNRNGGLFPFLPTPGGVYRYRIQAEPAGEPVVFGSALLYREQDGLWIELKTDRPTAAILFFSRPV